ncbi:MAG: dihydroorotate dehydrogenase electron transfer subunit [Pirellulales bacterium]
MSTSTTAACYADRAWHGSVPILENTRLARDTYRVRLAAPEIARRIVPGQFIMLRLAGCDDPLLARPLAMYETIDDEAGQPAAIDVVYLVVGKMTGRLAHCIAGQRLEVWGPLGNGFPLHETGHVVMVAGGIGQTPFLALAREFLGQRRYGLRESPLASRVTLCYGARAADLLAGVEDFRAAGVDVRISTDDGSAGHHGLVTDLLQTVLDEDVSGEQPDIRIVCCGPEKMMAAVASLAANRQVPCEVSLETPMACGIGICFSCVARVRDDQGTWDYRRTCVEGPIFDAARLVF